MNFYHKTTVAVDMLNSVYRAWREDIGDYDDFNGETDSDNFAHIKNTFRRIYDMSQHQFFFINNEELKRVKWAYAHTV
jgi:hypothetical protein